MFWLQQWWNWLLVWSRPDQNSRSSKNVECRCFSSASCKARGKTCYKCNKMNRAEVVKGMNRQIPSLEVMEKTAKHKGHAYSCVPCSWMGKSYIDVKSRVENHIYKFHLAFDQCLYFCTLCLFRLMEKTPLQQHVYIYTPHRQEAQNMGVTDSTPFLQESPALYTIEDSDYVQHSQQESLRLFLQKNKHF